ncbi:hypothetical protein HMN09_00283500 [Mycena chlorophos]|uniref:ER membrane protein complex subunit 1 n=1 Tax=Mycena chlorophos TaxID=658473 RepID=A0A8H6TPJ3_MYCCL|nr:hypothetical protein HMN09_00283500 [Mycena chlorophos]
MRTRTASALKFSLALFLLWVGYTNIDRFKKALVPEPFENEDPQWDSDMDVDMDMAYSHLLDVALVASVDGSFHLLQRSTGHSRWSIASKDKTLLPLVNTSQPSNSDASLEQYIIEPQSGDIYVLASPPETSPLRRFPYSMPQLVDMSPFTFEDLLFVGEQETFELTIDLHTGHFKTSSGADSWRDAWLKAGDFGDLTPEQIAHMGYHGAQEVSIARTDYRVSTSIHKRPSSKDTLVHNLAFSIYGPSNRDSTFQAAYTKTGDDVYVQGLPSGEIMAFKAGALRWAAKLASPMIAAFDAMNPPGVYIPEDFVALLQPRPRMSTMLPQSEEVAPSRPGSVYIGLVEETCSLFAMSPERFPLIAMDGVGRRQQPDASSPDAHTAGKQQTEVSPESAESSDRCAEQRRLVGMRRIEDEDGSGMGGEVVASGGPIATC